MKNIGIISSVDGPTAVYIAKKQNTKNTILILGGTVFAILGIAWTLFRRFITRK